MTQPRHSTRVVAVDGGGTRCRLACDDARQRTLVEAGSANVFSNFDAAIAEIRTGLRALAQASGLSMAEIAGAPTYLGLAGVTDAAMADRVAQALGLPTLRVEDDRPAALRGALGRADGMIAHLGTGSFFAMQQGGRTRLAGGWGPRLGDGASAFRVASAALAATLDSVDGLIEPTDLTAAILARFGPPAAIVALAATAQPGEIASLAPMVTSAAELGDAVALGIMRAAADHIAGVATRMGWTPGMAFCVTGGLGPSYRGYLSDPLRAALVAPRAAPIDGAIDLARAFAADARQ